MSERFNAGTFALDGLTVNRMGFGAMRLTGKGIWGEPEDPEAARAVSSVEMATRVMSRGMAS